MIKVAAPNMALKIIDDAIQAHGGGGVTTDFGLAKAYAGIRTLRLADGPDEVHVTHHRAAWNWPTTATCGRRSAPSARRGWKHSGDALARVPQKWRPVCDPERSGTIRARRDQAARAIWNQAAKELSAT